MDRDQSVLNIINAEESFYKILESVNSTGASTSSTVYTSTDQGNLIVTDGVSVWRSTGELEKASTRQRVMASLRQIAVTLEQHAGDSEVWLSAPKMTILRCYFVAESEQSQKLIRKMFATMTSQLVLAKQELTRQHNDIHVHLEPEPNFSECAKKMFKRKKQRMSLLNPSLERGKVAKGLEYCNESDDDT